MLQELIHKARRRLLFNEVLKQFALSAALAIAGVAVLLTVGTRYVEWWVVALLAIGVTAWAVAKLRKRLPSDYAAAVWLDDKAGLHDSLSTAHYYASSQARGATLSTEVETMLLAQRGQAEAMAGGVDIADTVPFRFPKALYGLAALMFVSAGLVSVRYFYGHQLNLNAPITEVVFQDLAATKQTKAGKPAKTPEKYNELEEARNLLNKLGLGANLEEKPNEQLDEALADALKSGEAQGASENAKLDQRLDKGDPLEAPKDAPKNNNSGAQAGENAKTSDSGDSSAGSQSGSKSGDKPDKSLLSKLKDAMDNMMGSPSPSSDKKSAGGKQQSKSSQSQATPQQGQAGDEDNKSAAEGEANGDAQKGKAPGQTSGNAGDKQEGPSAAGSEDGLKAVKAMAQMKAMGKISELIGKRSDQVTGESMIEVQSGNQHLQTAYKDKAATHGEGAGEVSRDEIPLEEQAYVQEYFQQVRKPDAIHVPPAPKANPKPAKK